MKENIAMVLIFIFLLVGVQSEAKDINVPNDISVLDWEYFNKSKENLKINKPNRQELARSLTKLYKSYKPGRQPGNPREFIKWSESNIKHMYIAYILSEYPDLMDSETKNEIYAHAKSVLKGEKREIWSTALMTLSHVAKKPDISIFVQFAKKSNSLLEPTLFSLKAVCFNEALEELKKLEVYFSEPSKKRLVRHAIEDWELVPLESRPWCGRR